MAGCGGDGKKVRGIPWGQIAGIASGSGTEIPCGDWEATGDENYAVSMGEVRGKLNTATVNLRIQYANDIRNPAGGVDVGSTINANGMLDPTTPTDISTIRSYRYWRPVWKI